MFAIICSSYIFSVSRTLFNLSPPLLLGREMNCKNLISTLINSFFLFVHLSALPQDQEVFLDFEDADGSADFTLGEPPNDIRFIGFTVETLEDTSLLHSGSRALTLGPGQEGKIFTEKGIQLLEFYVAESTGAGKIEIRGRVDEDRRELVDFREDFYLFKSEWGSNGITCKYQSRSESSHYKVSSPSVVISLTIQILILYSG